MTTERQQSIESCNSRNEIHLFCKKVILFVVPFVIFCTPPAIVLLLTGEHFRDLDSVLMKMEKQDFLVGYAYSGQRNYRYMKFRRLSTLPPQSIVAVGSSRVLGFRASMFESSFYNAGYSVLTISDMTDLVRSLPSDRLPNAMIVGLDQWMFHPQWENEMRGTVAKDWQANTSTDLMTGARNFPRIYKDVLRGKISIADLVYHDTEVTPVGIFGWMKRTGYTNDGGYLYGSHIDQLLSEHPQTRDLHFSDTLRRVESGIHRFVWSEQVSQQAIKDLRELLCVCRTMNIDVIAIVPPFGDAVADAMHASGKFKYIDLIEPSIRNMFAENDAELHVFHSMSSCGSSDSEAIDGFHGSDVTYLRMLLRMIATGSIVRQHIDKDRLVSDLRNRKNRYEVYTR